jgi:hypothetical protein
MQGASATDAENSYVPGSHRLFDGQSLEEASFRQQAAG